MYMQLGLMYNFGFKFLQRRKLKLSMKHTEAVIVKKVTAIQRWKINTFKILAVENFGRFDKISSDPPKFYPPNSVNSRISVAY